MSPYPSHPPLQDIFCWSNTPRVQAFNTPSQEWIQGCGDAGMRAARPLPADLAEPRFILTPPPQNACGGLAPTPPNPPLEIQKHAGLRSNALQQGPALLVPRHTKARWRSRRCRDGGFIPGGFIPVFRVSSPRESGSDPQEHGAERGAPGSGLGWREPLCYHHYCLSFEGRKGGKNEEGEEKKK